MFQHHSQQAPVMFQFTPQHWCFPSFVSVWGRKKEPQNLVICQWHSLVHPCIKQITQKLPPLLCRRCGAVPACKKEKKKRKTFWKCGFLQHCVRSFQRRLVSQSWFKAIFMLMARQLPKTNRNYNPDSTFVSQRLMFVSRASWWN